MIEKEYNGVHYNYQHLFRVRFYCKEKDCKKQLSIIYRKVISLQSLKIIVFYLIRNQLDNNDRFHLHHNNYVLYRF